MATYNYQSPYPTELYTDEDGAFVPLGDGFGYGTTVDLNSFGRLGTANDSVVFQKAIDWMYNFQVRGVIRIPAGTFKIQGVRFYEGTYMEGAGAGATVLTVPDDYDNTGNFGTALLNADNKGDFTTFEFGGLRGVELRGPGSGIETIPGNRNQTDINNNKMYRVNGIDFKALDYPGGSGSRLYQWQLVECRIGNFNIGANFYKNLYDVTIRDNFVHNCMIGIYWDLQHPNVLNNDIRYNDIGIFARICIDGAFTQNRISLGRIGLTGDFAGTYNTLGTGASGFYQLSTISLMLRTNLTTGTINVGDTVTGVTSGATGKVIVKDSKGIRITNVVGTFQGDPDGEPDFLGSPDTADADPGNDLEGEALTFSGGATAVIDYIPGLFNGGIHRSAFNSLTFWQNQEMGLDLGYQNRVIGCLFKGPRGSFPTPIAGNSWLNLRQRQCLVASNHFFGDNEGPGIRLSGTNAATQGSNIIIGNQFYLNYGPAIEKTGNGSMPDHMISNNNFTLYADPIGSVDDEGNSVSRYIFPADKGLIMHIPNGSGQFNGFQFTGNTIRFDGTSISAGDPVYTTGDIALTTPLVNILDIGAGAGIQAMVMNNYFKLTAGVTAPGIYLANASNSKIESNIFYATTTGSNSFTPSVSFGGTTTNLSVYGNLGFKTEARGQQAFNTSDTVKTVTHGLAITPRSQDIWVQFAGGTGNQTKVWVSNITATTFDINLNVAPGTGIINVNWDIASRYNG